MANRREFSRVTVPIDVEVEIEGRRIEGQLRDVSMIGAFVPTTERLAPDARCRVRIFLDGRDGEARIEAEGRIARADGVGIAVEFDDLVGIDSYRHLRNLVLYNAEDPDAVEREVDEHVGIRRRG